MTQLINTISDRLLAVFVPRVEAGACVGGAGECCKCQMGYRYVLDCYGNCVQTATRGCVSNGGACS